MQRRGVIIPNWFAYVALFGWPIVCLVLFLRLPIEKAAIWSLLGGYMLLPSDWAVKVPPLPPLDKMGITSIGTLLLCLMKGDRDLGRRTTPYLMYACAAAFVIAPIFTSFGNSFELQTAGKSVPGFYVADGIKFAGRNILALIPLYIGGRYISSDSARSMLIKAIPSAMVVYSLPMLFEVRMSPQLHRRLYGYFPGDSFAQQMRAGGFRPVVFFSHGLELALFTSVALISAIVLFRCRTRILRFSAGLVTIYLSGLLLVCKSLGPTIYAFVFGPLVMFSRPRSWVKFAFAASIIICGYPLLRSHGLAPTQLVSDAANMISADRTASFQTRIENEGQLLAKANEKPLFGWGGWGRNRIFDRWTGEDISTTDGGWIIQFGTFGWLGYLSFFGLFVLAQWRALRRTGSEKTTANLTRGGLALLLGIYLIDSIPNATEIPIVLLLAGSIANSRRGAPPWTGERIQQPSEAQSPASRVPALASEILIRDSELGFDSRR